MEPKYVKLTDRAKCILVDIDGCVLRQGNFWPDIEKIQLVLPGVKQKLTEWHMRGHRIILLTARPEAYRAITEQQLKRVCLVWDQLLMGLPTGQRVLINDRKPEEAGMGMALAVNLDRDEGLEGIDL